MLSLPPAASCTIATCVQALSASGGAGVHVAATSTVGMGGENRLAVARQRDFPALLPAAVREDEHLALCGEGSRIYPKTDGCAARIELGEVGSGHRPLHAVEVHGAVCPAETVGGKPCTVDAGVIGEGGPVFCVAGEGVMRHRSLRLQAPAACHQTDQAERSTW